MPAPFDTPDSPLWSDGAEMVDGGFVDNTEPHLLAPNQAVKLLNIEPTVAGRLQKRLGIEKLGSAGTGNPNGLFPFEAPLQNIQLLVGQWGNSLYSSPGDDVWSPRATTVSLANTIYAHAQGRGNSALPTLFLASCVGVTDNVSLPFGNLIALDSNFGVTEIAMRARAIAWFQSRLWAFNNAASGADYLSWSSVFDGRNFSNGQNVQVDADSGDQGVAIVPMRDGTPRMYLAKERSIHQLELYWTTDGYYPTTANALDFTKSILRPITYQAGAIATRAMVWAGTRESDLIFLSRDGIRGLPRGLTDAQAPLGLPLSWPIQQTIDRITWQYADRSAAAYFNNKVYFSVPVDGSDKPNHVIAYDINRLGWFEIDWDVAAWAPCKLQSQRNFFFLGSTAGTETGLGALGSGVTNGYHVYQTDASSIDPFGQPIQFDVITRAFTFDQGQQPGAGLAHKKLWNYLDMAIQAAATAATLTLQYKVDDDDSFTELRKIYVDPESGYPILPVQLPFSFSSGRVVHYSLSLRDVRPGYKIQFRFLDDTSFARMKVISLRCLANPLNPNFRTPTLP
jgi:hypothetical protein